MQNAYIMALDAGTGSGRAVIYDTTGAIAGIGQEEWTHLPDPGVPGSSVFDTSTNGPLIDRVIGAALAQAGIGPERIKAVSTTSMREGMVLYDAEGSAIWACPNTDSRAQEEALELARTGVADEIFDLAGDWVSITAPSRFAWLKRHRPDILSATVKVGMISDWMTFRLTGRFVTEPSAGSSSALFDLEKRTWAEPLVTKIGLDPAILPEVVESGTVVGGVSAEAAALTGLIEGTPVVSGGADTQLALVGIGAGTGDATLVGGSFWQMTMLTDAPLIDPDRGPRTLCHARPGAWMTEGIGFLSGLTLRWYRDAFIEPVLRRAGSAMNGFLMLEEMAAQAGVGAGGVLALTASPMQSDDWRQPPVGLFGFDLNAGERALGNGARAIMESGAFLAKRHLEALERLSGQTFPTIGFTGGSAQGDTWAQIIADVMQRPVAIPVVKETTALGCAMLAATGAGLFNTLDEAIAAMASPTERTVMPDPERSRAYAEIEARWFDAMKRGVDMAEDGLCAPLWRPGGSRHEAEKAEK